MERLGRVSADARWGRTFHCGPFSGERYRGALRWVEAGGVECLRMVGVVVRDSAWRTLTPSKLVERAKGERWTVDGRTAAGSGTLLWRLSLLPRPRGMEVRAAMRACGNVLTNRSGLVVLLPAARFAGARYVVRHADTREEHGLLPRDIAPHQPLRDAAALRLSVARGPALAFTFAGDTFEMEDQRNWLDPSFAAARMNRGIRAALAGKRVDDV